jgi:hypothetical protein
MARLLNCQDMGLECDFLCAETEKELVLRASQYVGLGGRGAETPVEFEERVLYLSQEIDRC